MQPILLNALGPVCLLLAVTKVHFFFHFTMIEKSLMALAGIKPRFYTVSDQRPSHC